MSVAYSINFPPKFLNTSNKRLTEALNVQSSYHLQCVHCAHAVTVYIQTVLVLSLSSSPAGFYVL